nr:hypothetical protein [Ktedonobacterales bacterium]
LVNRCVPADAFEATVRELATRLANGPTVAYRLIKEQLYRSADSDMATALRIEGELQDIAINTADHREAVTAFLGKRPPHYEGR